MKTHTSLALAVRQLLCLLLFLTPWLPAAAQEVREYPLGPIGGSYRVTGNSSLAKISALTTGEPGATAGLQVGDFIYGAFGQTFTPTGGDHYGVSQELGFAVDRAEGGDGILPLLIVRPGTGGMTVNVTLPAAGTFGVAYPRNSAKYAAFYETAVADLHTRAMNGNGSMGYLTGFTGLCLLGHPNWNDTSGAKSYRLSINKIRDRAVNLITNWGYAPTENKLLDGSAIPNPSGGPSNWELGQLVMFLSEYYVKTTDGSVAASLQRGVEMCGNTVQWWKQPSENANGFSPGYSQVAGMCSHGGVTGDYMHQGWYCGINMTGVHNFGGMAFARRAGMDMSVRPKDGHYFGFNLTQGVDLIPPSIANALPSSITLPQYAEDPVQGSTINDPFWYDPSVNQKFLMQLNFICRRSLGGDGCVGYAPESVTSYDAGGRTPGALLGLAMYQQDVGGLDAADLNRMEMLKNYMTTAYMQHQNAHAYCIGGQAFQALATPYLSDRQQRFFMDNWRFFFALSRTATNGFRYFQARGMADSGAYLEDAHCASINIALPYGIANGNYSLIPGYNTNRSLANFKSPVLMWPSIAARTAKVYSSSQAFEVDVCDGEGNVLSPASYTATWSHVSGPATATFSPNNTANTTVTLPTVSATPYRIRLTVTRAGVPDLVEDIDVTRANTTTPVPNVIASHPANQTTVPGGSASFTVGVAGTGPFVYQWRLNGVAYWGSTTSPTISLTNLGSGAIGSYDCVVSTPTGLLTSNSATLSFNATLARTPGGLRREIWAPSYGSAVSDLTSSSSFPLFPNVTNSVNAAEAPGYGDNYGQKLSGWLKPPMSGTYKFFISSDDASQLWLSTDDTAGNKVKIADFTGATSYRSYSTGAQSALINLVAGQKYYIEFLHKEAGGGDHVSVAWQMPGEAVPPNGSAPIDEVYLEYEQYLPLLTNHWKLDEASGTTCADSVGTATATLYNGPTRVAGILGNAVSFNGVNQYAQANLDVSETLSAVSLWFRTTQASGGLYSVVNGGGGYDRCICLTGGNLSAYIWSGETIVSTGTTYNDGQWHHVVHTFGGGIGGQKLYVDGVQVASGTKAQSDFNGQTAIKIGHAANAASPYFDGQIDDVRIYNAGLSVPDSVAIYQAGLNAAPLVSPGTFSLAENSAIGTVVGPLTGTDPNPGQTISYSIVGGNVGGRFALNSSTGEITVAVPPDFETSGAHVLTITATDNGTPVQSATTTATVNISDVNEAPVFASNPVIGQPGAPGIAYSGTLTATDADAGSSVSYSKLGGPSWLSIASNGTLTGTPSAGDLGINDFAVRATDNTALTTDATLRIEVVNVAVNPVWTNPSGGSWPVAGNWLANGIASGQSIVADFSTLNLTADTTVTLDGARTIGGLKFGDTTPSHNWTLNTGSGGALTLSVASGKPVINVVNQTATIGAALAGTQGLVKAGSGSLALSGTSTGLSGGTTVSAGTLQLNNAFASNGLITLNDANTSANNTTLGFNSSSAVNPVTVANQGTGISAIAILMGGDNLSFSSSSATYTFNRAATITAPNRPSGNYTLFYPVLSGSGTLTLGSTNNSRLILLGNSPAFTGNIIVENGAILEPRTSLSAPNGNNIEVKSGGRLRLFGSASINALTGAGAVDSFVAAGTLTVGTGNGSGTFSGTMLNNSTALSLTKTGTGTQVLSGSGTYTGPTAINGGTLLINGSLANTPTTVAAAGTLGGTGTIAGTVTNNGTLAPGDNAIGSLTVNNTLTLAGNSHIACELADWEGAAGTGYDKLTATSLDLTATAGSPVTIHLLDASLANFQDLSRTFTLVQTTSGITGFDPAKFLIDDSALTAPQGVWTIEQSGNNLVLVYTSPNQAPTFTSDPILASAVVNLEFTGQLGATDPDAGDTLTFTKLTGSAWLTVAANGALSGTPDTAGTNNFTVRVTDSHGVSDTAALEIEVVDYTITTRWTNVAGGSWPIAGNWLDNTIADGNTAVADFSTLNLTANTTVTLDAARTIGGLKFGDTTPSHNWTLNTGSGGPLNLQVVAGSPVITVTNQTATLGAALTGNQGLVKSGPGTLVLSGSNTGLSGGATISAGTLQLDSAAAAGTGNITLGDANTGANMVNLTLGNSAVDTGFSQNITVASSGTGTATLKVSDIGIGTSGTGTITLNRAATLDGTAISNAYYQSNRPLSGTGTLTYNGASGKRFILNVNSPAFTGDVVVQSGIFEPRSSLSAPNGNNIEVKTGGVLRLFGSASINALTGAGAVDSFVAAGTLTVGAGNGSGTFSGTMLNNSTALSLTKVGTGTQALSGSGTYTGATNINGGTLLINGSLGNTSTTIATAGKLGGSGTIAGTVTSNGTLAPGNNAVGNLTVNNTLTLAAGSNIEWEIGNWTGSAGTGWDKATVTSLNLTATSANRVTIRPVDLALANFTETNSSFLLIQTTSGITGFSADKFTIDTSGLTLPHGTWSVQQSGNNLVLAYTANADANGNSIADNWETAHFGNANTGANLPGDDADKDGLSNLMEYALGTNPLANNAGPAVDYETIAGTPHLRITVNKNPQASNLTYIVETCGALNDWSAANTVIETNTATQLIVRDTFGSATALRRFIRLMVISPP